MMRWTNTWSRGAARALLLATTLALALPATQARAFCGFYVGGDDTALRNDATMVVMMRQGTTTVLAMRNAYQGPPEDFAMVVPVPTVIQEENVRILPAEVFDRVDHLAAPRLVEYWEQDPCNPSIYPVASPTGVMLRGAMDMELSEAVEEDLGVTVEAEFAVAEYDIVILSAEDSGGLDTWLRREGYHIPAGAESALRPYVAQGTKFFVAKVDVQRVHFQNGRAVLSPLRVHYQTQDFALPVRLGLVNSAGTQDLLVHILSKEGRFETANYPNVFVPTNLEVSERVRGNFGAFYASLFDEVQRRNPGSVVTEYAWQSGSCDPCPGPTLTSNDLMTLGADVTGNDSNPMAYTLTRLHYRYGRGGLDEDLVFRRAPGVNGGRGTPDPQGVMPQGNQVGGSTSQFQGRYAMLHRWEGAVECESPRRGLWGGPPGGGAPAAQPAVDLATQSRSGALSSFFPNGASIPAIGVTSGQRASGTVSQGEHDTSPEGDGDENAHIIEEEEGCRASSGAPAGTLALFAVIGIALGRRRR